MTKSQKNLIGLLFSVLLFAIIVFRGELLYFPNRPRIHAFMQDHFSVWGISISILLFGYFLAKTFKTRWWLFIALFIFWECAYIFVFNFGTKFFPESIKSNGYFGHFKGVALANRPLIQFEENCARYDSTLFYTLKPGNSNFASYEFDNQYHVNSVGFRDSESDLNYPEVLFLGDSFTMGWGIDQDKTFAQGFENQTKLKCLNSGISSYGTAREYFNFKKVKTDSLKLIVVQYHDTDLEENNYWVKNKKLGDKTELEFENQVKNNTKVKKYYLFKHVKAAIIQFLTPTPNIDTNAPSSGLGSEYKRIPSFTKDFYEIVQQIRADYSGPIIFTYTGSFYTEPKVVEAFENYAESNKINDVYFVNMGGKLTTEDYYFLDDHINAKGHEKIGNELVSKWKTISHVNN
jgi:hypothetical protein